MAARELSLQDISYTVRIDLFRRTGATHAERQIVGLVSNFR